MGYVKIPVYLFLKRLLDILVGLVSI